MQRLRLDSALVQRKLCSSRSQAQSYIDLGMVQVNSHIETKSSRLISHKDKIKLLGDQYVSRAAFKIASVAKKFGLDFDRKTILDVGSSTGGFTDYALQHGAKRVVAVDVGTDQLHQKLRRDKRVELHEKTDIRDFVKMIKSGNYKNEYNFGIVVADVSFISLKEILPSISQILSPNSYVVAMCKPQFETGNKSKNKGVIKNDAQRRLILKDFESWAKQNFVLIDKADSLVSGAKGNLERFYLLKKA